MSSFNLLIQSPLQLAGGFTRDNGTMMRGEDLYQFIVHYFDLITLAATANTCKLLYCKFNSELVQRRLCSVVYAHILELPGFHFQHSAYCLLRRIHPFLLVRQDDVVTKIFSLGNGKKRSNLHSLSVLPAPFPVLTCEQVRLRDDPSTSFPTPSSPSFQSHHQQEYQCKLQAGSPFALLTKDADSGAVNARLSCIAYFEVSFVNTDKTYLGKEEQHWSLGITNCSNPAMLVAYNHSGKIFKTQHCLANNPYYKFSINDTVGCGIIFPPLSSNNRGQIFFTRNGELIHTEDLSCTETFGAAWYPFALCGRSYRAKFNLGRKDSFLFNIHVFESLKTKHIGPSAFSVYEELFFKQADYQRFSLAMGKVVSKECSMFQKDPKALDATLPVLKEIHNPVVNGSSGSGNDSEMDFKSEDDSNGESESNSSVPMSSRLSSDQSLSALPLHGILSKPSSKWIDPNFAMSWSQAVDDSKKSSTSTFDVSGKRRDSKQDLDEDSMVVELSSVDSMAMSEMRDCELNPFRDQERVVEHCHKFRTPLYLAHKDLKFNQQPSTGSSASLFNSADREESKPLSMDSRSMSPTQVLSPRYAALSDSGLASSWLQKATEEANIRSKEQAAKPGGDIVNANLILDGYDSERSVATSLFVEVASVDEYGSYKAYGAACEGDVVEDGDVYIRGRLVKSDSTGLQFDSDESEGTCGARWDQYSQDGSEQTGSRKQKRRRSSSNSSTSKRAKLGAADNSTVSNHHSSISYLAATACISSVMLDGEDGYDGASELRSYDGDFIDDHITDNDVHHRAAIRAAPGPATTSLYGCSSGQNSANHRNQSILSSATTSIYSGSPDDGCNSDQAISGANNGKEKKRHLK